MCEPGLAEDVLSWFTRPDRAATITGDLLEESRTRSTCWFWLQVMRTMLSLFVQAILSAPMRMTTLIIMGILSLVIGLPLAVHLSRAVVESRSILQFIGWHPSFFYWWKWWFTRLVWGDLLYPFLVGLTVARFAREKEMVVCCALAVGIEALVLSVWFWRVAIAHVYTPTNFLALSSLPLIGLLGAGIFARHRALHRMSGR